MRPYGIALLLILFFINAYSQELNVGGIAGINSSGIVAFGGAIEYKPEKAILSFNSDPVFLIEPEDLIFTVPLYLKLRIGNKVKFCPIFGVFVRTNENHGWNAGLNIELKIKDRLTAFIKTDYEKDYFESNLPSHFGSDLKYTATSSSMWISIGIKRNILSASGKAILEKMRDPASPSHRK